MQTLKTLASILKRMCNLVSIPLYCGLVYLKILNKKKIIIINIIFITTLIKIKIVIKILRKIISIIFIILAFFRILK